MKSTKCRRKLVAMRYSQPVLVPGVRSLKEQCTSVIVCGLLEQWALESDQVPARLPDYVPPTIKHFIASRYKAHKTPKCDREAAVKYVYTAGY